MIALYWLGMINPTVIFYQITNSLIAFVSSSLRMVKRGRGLDLSIVPGIPILLNNSHNMPIEAESDCEISTEQFHFIQSLSLISALEGHK